ncbi:MAG: PLP-dependent aminotransferase family protein [Alphaproteobacteria bacterium]|nr:PLP-dependent aminotransferase family protein [Alphaproteobacteria bacterium]
MTIWVPTLDRTKPLYLAIADAISADVAAGALGKGDRLPPQRDLAWKLGVTLGTVTRAYKEAELRGLLAGEVGRGSYIKADQKVAALQSISGDGLVDLTHAIPPPVVTAGEFELALQSVMRDPRKLELLDYAPVEGLPQHKAMAAKWLLRSGIETPESNIFVTSGAFLGLVTTLGALCEPGEAVMAENINYSLLKSTFKNAKLNIHPLEMDHEGLTPSSFEHAARSKVSRCVYVVPTLQNPTTSTMSMARREHIVAIARRFDITIIEDDIFRLLDARVQPPTLYSLAPERTYHITSLSKTLAPGLRIGFVVTPRGQDRTLRGYVRTMPSRPVSLAGEVARYWIESDAASQILSRTRNEFASLRAAFVEVFRGASYRCEPGAPYAWLELPPQWTGVRFASTLLAHNIRVSSGGLFELTPHSAPRHIRICFGAVAPGFRVRQAFETIRSLMNDADEADFTPVA